MEQVVIQLHSHGAPTDVLVRYLELIDNVDKRVVLAHKLQCHKAVINVSKSDIMSTLCPMGSYPALIMYEILPDVFVSC